MSDLDAYIWIVIGIVVAIIFPIIRNQMSGYWKSLGSDETVPNWVKKYTTLGVFSLISGVIILAIIRNQGTAIDDWWTAFLAGFAWESAVEKVLGKSSDRL